MTEKRRIDRETIIVCALIAMLAAVGIIFAVILFFGWDLTECDSTKMVSLFSVLAGSISGILLCRNC